MAFKRSIAFYCCTNGLGHYKRVLEVAKHLTDSFDITIFCNQRQASKIGILEGVSYEYYTVDNIRWDLVTNGNSEKAIEQYFQWSAKYLPTSKSFDIVVSDNLPVLLVPRPDTILMGSFLWKDVFEHYIQSNKITTLDTKLIDEWNPPLLTNKYLETQSVKGYSNRIQFGFGCEERYRTSTEPLYPILQYPSLEYSNGYSSYLDKISQEKNLGEIKDLSYIENTYIVTRAGAGTITHCAEHNIPLIALYSNKDSAEIIELAQAVEDLGMGYKQNIEEPFDINKIKTGKYYTQTFEKQGYKNIANYLKNYEVRNRW